MAASSRNREQIPNIIASGKADTCRQGRREGFSACKVLMSKCWGWRHECPHHADGDRRSLAMFSLHITTARGQSNKNKHEGHVVSRGRAKGTTSHSIQSLTETIKQAQCTASKQVLPGRQLPTLPGISIETGQQGAHVAQHSADQAWSTEEIGDHMEDRLQNLTLYSMTQTKALRGILKKLMMVERACSGR